MPFRSLVSGGGGGGSASGLNTGDGSVAYSPNGADEYLGLQAVIDDNPRKRILLPDAILNVTRPIVVHDGVELVGRSRSGATLVRPMPDGSFVGGPILNAFSYDDFSAIPKGPALLANDDYSYHLAAGLDASERHFFDFATVGVFPRGWSNFKFAQQFTPRGSLGYDAFTFFIGGNRRASEATSLGYIRMLIGFDSSNHWYAYAYIGGSIRSISTSVSAVADQSTHLELSYDGTTLRLFVDGVLAGSTAATGTFTTNSWHGIYLGFAPYSAWNPTPFYVACLGDYGYAELSSAAGHTSGFTPPTSTPSGDINTWFLWHPTTANEYGCFYKVPITNGFGWVKHQRYLISLDTENAFSNIWVSDAGRKGNIAFWVVGTLNAQVLDCRSQFCGYGLMVQNNCFDSYVGRFEAAGGQYTSGISGTGTQYARMGLITSNNCTITKFDRCKISSFGVGMSMTNGVQAGQLSWIYTCYETFAALQNVEASRFSFEIIDEGQAEGDAIKPDMGVWLSGGGTAGGEIDIHLALFTANLYTTFKPIVVDHYEGNYNDARIHFRGTAITHASLPAILTFGGITPNVGPKFPNTPFVDWDIQLDSTYSTAPITLTPGKVRVQGHPLPGPSLGDANETIDGFSNPLRMLGAATTLTGDRTYTLDSANIGEGVVTKVVRGNTDAHSATVVASGATSTVFPSGKRGWVEYTRVRVNPDDGTSAGPFERTAWYIEP